MAKTTSRTRKAQNAGRTILGTFARSVLLAATLTGAALTVSGCAVSENDVHRWETTERGPGKLYAVVTHDKYAFPLRVEAALSLIRMKPRSGKHWAIPYLVDGFKDDTGEVREGALLVLPPPTRAKLVEAMAPELIKQMQSPPPPRNPDGSKPPDPSTAYKDAAFAMLSHDPPLVTDDKVKADLSNAITQWAHADFENRLDSSQQYGIEQVLRFLGANSVKALPAMLTESSTKIDRIAALIHDLGDAETKQKASVALVALAKKIDSKEWIDRQTPLVEEADKRANQKVTKEQLAEQVKKFQDQELVKIFTAMKKVGGRPSIEYALAYAANKDNNEDRRKAALAAIEGTVDKTQTKDIETLFEIAKDDTTPDSVRDLAFQRLGELPKEVVVPKMYQLFDAKKWKVRWVAASLIMKTLTTKGLPAFLERLPKTPATKMGMTEPISYGAIVKGMDAPAGEPKPRDAILPYLPSKDFGAKLTALGFFYGGSKKDVGVVQPYEGDATAVPACAKEDECGWQCEVPKSAGETESKDIKTVGEFVKFCLIPSMTSP
jgi:HEAT repeat protein